MAPLKSCCCWKSVRSGSFASAIYTMIFYTVVVTAGSFHVNTILELPASAPVLLTFSILMLAFASCSVLSSGVLILGLCLDNHHLLLPWMIAVSSTSILDVILSIYLAINTNIDPFFAILFVTDFFICALNVYCLLCVASQYQHYKIRRGRRRQVMVDGVLPAIHFEPASCVGTAGGEIANGGRLSPKITIGSIRNGTFTPGQLLVGKRNSGSSRTNSSSSGGHLSSVARLLSRSSISSTSEISFSSSGGSSSRRGSLFLRDRSDSLAGRAAVTQFSAAISATLGERFLQAQPQINVDPATAFYPIEDEQTEYEVDADEETVIFVPEIQSQPGAVSRFRHSNLLRIPHTVCQQDADAGKASTKVSPRRSALICEEDRNSEGDEAPCEKTPTT